MQRANNNRSISDKRQNTSIAKSRGRSGVEPLETRLLFTTFVWDGGAVNSNWSSPANWVGGVAPPTDGTASLEFGSAGLVRKNPVNNYPAGSLFDNLFFSDRGYTLTGNAVTLNDDIIATSTGTGTNTVALDVTMTEGTSPISSFRTDGTTLVVSGVVATETNNILRLQGVSNVRVTGVITGSGNVSKRGSGPSTITADNTYAGGTTIDSGSTLTIDHAGTGSATGTAEVDVDGNLRGVGRIGGPLAIRSGGDLFPGVGSNSTGILNTGNLSIASTGRYSVNVTGTTAGSGFDQINVTGSVNLSSGALLAVTPAAGFAPVEGNTFTIINNDDTDAVIGTFSGLPQGGIVSAGGNSYQIDYAGGDGNDVTLTVVVANDPPVNSVPGSQSTPQDTALLFRAASGNLISISDPDAGAEDVQLSLTVMHGNLTLNSTTGLAFSIGDGSADSAMVFTGSLDSINAALSTVTYAPTNGFHGATTLSISTNDLGHTGPGGPQSDSDTIAITVVDASVVAPVAADDAASHDIAQAVDINVLANDSDPLSRTLTLSIANQGTGGTATVNDHGTPSDPTDDTITYTPNPGYAGDDTFTYRLTTGQGSTSTATVTVTTNSGVALDQDPEDPTKQALFIVGTDDAETIKIARKKTQIRVLINKVQVGDLMPAPTGSIIIIAKGGNDVLSVGALKANPARFYGGDGDDKITGSKFNDVLVGGAGNDIIKGGAGNDIILAGGGADRVTGSGGDDLITAGATSYNTYTAQNTAALRDLLTAWSNGTDYTARVTAITSDAGVGASGAHLVASTLQDDNDIDTLNGSGGSDVFFANLTAGAAIDKLKKAPTETVVELG